MTVGGMGFIPERLLIMMMNVSQAAAPAMLSQPLAPLLAHDQAAAKHPPQSPSNPVRACTPIQGWPPEEAAQGKAWGWGWGGVWGVGRLLRVWVNGCAQGLCAQVLCAQVLCAQVLCAQGLCAQGLCAQGLCAQGLCAQGLGAQGLGAQGLGFGQVPTMV